MKGRREVLSGSMQVALLLAGAGLLPGVAFAARQQSAFDARTLAEVVKALGGSVPAESREVSLTGPDIAENGAAVQLGVATTAAGAKRLLVLVEKNPSALSAVFEISEALEPGFVMRVKMNESSNVYAVALLADGRALYARKDIRVTLGGCVA